MLHLLLAGLGCAFAAPPEGVDPDDLDRWEALAERALAGPEGCWEFEGLLTVEAKYHSRAALWRRSEETAWRWHGPWTGRLDAGVWTRFAYELKGDSGKPGEFPIYPVIGKIDPKIVEAIGVKDDDEESGGVSISVGGDGGEAEAVSMLRKAIDSWNTSAAFSYGAWSDERQEVKLIQEVPTDEKPNAPTISVTTLFPGGEPFASRMSAVFPRRIPVGEWPLRGTVYDGQFHLVQQRVAGVGLPQAENMAAAGSMLGFSVSYEQRIDYRTARRCASTTPAGATGSSAGPVSEPPPAGPPTED